MLSSCSFARSHKLANSLFDRSGYLKRTNAVSLNLLDTLLPLFRSAKTHEDSYRNSQDLVCTPNTVHHLPLYSPIFLELLTEPSIKNICQQYFSSNYILHSYNGVLASNYSEYVNKIHRDTRLFFEHSPEFLNIFIPLSAFGPSDGPLYLYPESQQFIDPPSVDAYSLHSIPMLVSPGDLVAWHSCLWHSLSPSNSPKSTSCAITLIFSRPYYKPQLTYDYKNLKVNEPLADEMEQLLGMHSVPAYSISSFHTQPQDWTYRHR